MRGPAGPHPLASARQPIARGHPLPQPTAPSRWAPPALPALSPPSPRLRELAHAQQPGARRDLVAVAVADLRRRKRQLGAVVVQEVPEVDKYALGGMKGYGGAWSHGGAMPGCRARGGALHESVRRLCAGCPASRRGLRALQARRSAAARPPTPAHSPASPRAAVGRSAAWRRPAVGGWVRGRGAQRTPARSRGAGNRPCRPWAQWRSVAWGGGSQGS